jgi:hypothetical protein
MHKYYTGNHDFTLGRDWTPGRDGVIATLLEIIDKLRLETDPAGGDATAVGKHEKSLHALHLAGQLVRELVGWAIDHQVGVAIQSIPPVPHLPLGVEGLRARAIAMREADSHSHEISGETAERADIPDFALRDILAAMMQVNAGGLPLTAATAIHDALKALDLGETQPIFAPVGRQGKSLRQRQLQLKAIEFVVFRRKRGQKQVDAEIVVLDAYGLTGETAYKQWRKQVAKFLGEFAVERAEVKAAHAASAAGERHKARLRGEELDSVQIMEEKVCQAIYGDDALKVAAAEYRKLTVEEGG